MADYTDFEIQGYVSLEKEHTLVVKALDWLCNASSHGAPMPQIPVKNWRWEQMCWGAEKRYFSKRNGYFHLLNGPQGDGCRGNPVPEFFSFIKPALLAEKGSVVGWYACESDNVKHELVV